MATGEQSGQWGTKTNSNLKFIGEALGFGTEAITTNANTHATTVATPTQSDAGRAIYIIYTGTLDSACTITISPDTMKRVHIIKNGTSGSQNILIKQGTGAGAAVTIPPGDTKVVSLNGGGSGAIVTDVFDSLSVVDLKVQDDLTVTDDVAIGGDLTVTGLVTANADMLLAGTTPTLTIGDAGEEDAKIVYDGNAVDFHVGLDDTDDKLKIGLGSALGTTPILTVSDGSLLLSGTTPTLTIGDAGEEDAKIVFDGNAQDFHIGLDDSVDDLVIGKGSALGTTPAISIDENLLVTIEDDATVDGRATSSTYTALNMLLSNGSNDEVNLALGNNFIATTTAGSTVFTFENPIIGQSGTIMFVNAGNHSVSMHASVNISAASLAVLQVTGTYMVSYFCSAASGDDTIFLSVSQALV